MIIAVTGHRPSKLNDDYELKSPLVGHIRKSIESVIDAQKPSKLISGMALGVDTLSALIAIDKKIPLIAALPCKAQYAKWPQKSRDIYNYILSHELTDPILINDTFYTPTCMQARNEWMVNNCDMLVAIWDGSNGGTANCVKYARSVDKNMMIIHPGT